MGNARNLFGNKKTRSALTFWLPICFLLSFFFINQFAEWSHYLNGETKSCSACPYAATGLEILWMYFPLMGAYITSKDTTPKNAQLFERYLLLSLLLLPGLTGAKIGIRFSSPHGFHSWLIGLILELNWVYVSIANLLIWIALNWKAESAKVEQGLSTAQWHCLIYYSLPVVLMLLAVIAYRTMEHFNYDRGQLLLATSLTELIFVLSPVKATLSWHFRP